LTTNATNKTDNLTGTASVNDKTNDKQLKAADWTRIAQEVVDSNDYVYKPPFQTYYSQCSGWYYYPNEKVSLGPKSEKLLHLQSRNYEPYAVATNESSAKEAKKTKKPDKIDHESEEGESSSSESKSNMEDNDGGPSDNEVVYDRRKI
jgi:hypothetical protein